MNKELLNVLSRLSSEAVRLMERRDIIRKVSIFEVRPSDGSDKLYEITALNNGIEGKRHTELMHICRKKVREALLEYYEAQINDVVLDLTELDLQRLEDAGASDEPSDSAPGAPEPVDRMDVPRHKYHGPLHGNCTICGLPRSDPRHYRRPTSKPIDDNVPTPELQAKWDPWRRVEHYFDNTPLGGPCNLCGRGAPDKKHCLPPPGTTKYIEDLAASTTPVPHQEHPTVHVADDGRITIEPLSKAERHEWFKETTNEDDD